jgi:hypothetical protein
MPATTDIAQNEAVFAEGSLANQSLASAGF